MRQLTHFHDIRHSVSPAFPLECGGCRGHHFHIDCELASTASLKRFETRKLSRLGSEAGIRMVGATPVCIKHHWTSSMAHSKLVLPAAAFGSSLPARPSPTSLFTCEKKVGIAASRTRSTYSLKILLQATKGQCVSMSASHRFGRLLSMVVSNISSGLDERYVL